MSTVARKASGKLVSLALVSSGQRRGGGFLEQKADPVLPAAVGVVCADVSCSGGCVARCEHQPQQQDTRMTHCTDTREF